MELYITAFSMSLLSISEILGYLTKHYETCPGSIVEVILYPFITKRRRATLDERLAAAAEHTEMA